MQNPHQANIETHIAVQDMAEFVGDDALELFTIEQFYGPAGNANDRVAGCKSRRKGVDTLFFSQ